MLMKTKIDSAAAISSARAGDELRRPVADDAAEQAGDGGAEQRQQNDEHDGEIHGARPSPSSR